MTQDVKVAIESALPLGILPTVLVRGVPGTGKSTFAKRLSEWINRRVHIVFHTRVEVRSATVYENDEFFVDPVSKQYKFDRDLCPIAAEWTIGRVAKECLHNPYDVPIIANTFTTFDEIDPYMKLARFFKRWLVVFTMTNTGFNSIHNVPDEVMEQMSNRFISFRKEIYVDKDNDMDVCAEFLKRILPLPE